MSFKRWVDKSLLREPQVLRVGGRAEVSGEVQVWGSKKTLPKLLIAALLTDEECRIDNVAWVEDVAVASAMLAEVSRAVGKVGDRTLAVSGAGSMPANPREAFASAGGLSRIPILALGPLVARFEEAWVPPLGGDRIGLRSLDQHLAMLEAMGAEVSASGGWLRAAAGELRPATFRLPFPMVGVTEHALLTAALVSGRTEIQNVAVDPEIQALASVLGTMGATVELDLVGRTAVVRGMPRLGGFRHEAPADRIEAASWACLAFAVRGDVSVSGVREPDLDGFLAHFRQLGGAATESSTGMRFTAAASRNTRRLQLETGPFPAFESDWQPTFLVAATQREGKTTIHETVFENRFATVEVLKSMGARIEMRAGCGTTSHCRAAAIGAAHVACVGGRMDLCAVEARVPDLRSGFGLLIAGLVAEGETVLHGAELFQRGYEDLPERVSSLGGSIDVVG